MIIEILYSIAGTVAIIAGSSQIRQLITAGRSDELSIATWSLWSGTQFVSLVYSVTIGKVPLIVFNLLWVVLYMAMVGLILYYRKYPRQLAVEPVIEEA